MLTCKYTRTNAAGFVDCQSDEQAAAEAFGVPPLIFRRWTRRISIRRGVTGRSGPVDG